MTEDRGRTRLYLNLPTTLLSGDITATQQRIAALTSRLDIACVNFEPGYADGAGPTALLKQLQEGGTAVLAGLDLIALFTAPGGPDKSALAAQIERARRLGFDGIHAGSDPDVLERARALLPQDAILGAFCGGSKHQAMVAGEAGADYIAFDDSGDVPLEDLVDWWQNLFEIPCVAWNVDEAALLAPLLALPADFLNPTQGLLENAEVIEQLTLACGRDTEAA